MDEPVLENGFTVWRCKRCDAQLFPRRLLCAHCHGAEFEPHRITEGVVEDISTIRHMIGQADWKPRRIANVRTQDGPRLTVGLLDDAQEGDAIVLFAQGAAPFGRRKA